MKLYALAFLLACVSAAPQVNLEGDAEVVSSGGSSGGSAGGDGGFIHIPFFTIFRPRPTIFGFNPSTDVDDNTGSDGGSIFNVFRGFLPSLFGGAGPGFPGFGSIPDGNENSTYEVTNVDGNRVEVNRTITTNDDGNFVFTQVLVRVTPDEDGGSASDSEGSDTASGTDTVSDGETSPVSPPPEVPAEVVDPSVNKDDVSASLVRRKRWSIAKWLKAILRPKVESTTVPTIPAPLPLTEVESHETADNVGASIPLDSIRKAHEFDGDTNAISTEVVDDMEAVAPQRSEEENLDLPSLPHSLEGDTHVNYLGPVLRDNPDAEIFDVELVRADEDRFFNRGDRPAYTEPLSNSYVAESFRSEPLRAMPLRSGPVLGQSSESMEDMSEPEKQELFSEDSFESALSEKLQSQAEEPEDNSNSWPFRRSLRLL